MGLFDVGSVIHGVYVGAEVPGSKITRSIGLVAFTKAGLPESTQEGVADLFSALLEAARERGANAVVNVHVTSGLVQEGGAKGKLNAYSFAFGDAVVIEPRLAQEKT